MHMQQEHRIQWHCSLPVHPPISFDEKEQFERHMLEDHKGKFDPLRLATLAEIASRPALRPFDECPLCKVASDGIDPVEGLARQPGGPDRLARHVAGHLKSLALMFLPPRDDTGDETGSESSPTNKRSGRIVNSKDSIFEASLTFEGDDYAPPPWAPDVEADEDWSLKSKTKEFDPKIDPTLQSFVKRAQPQQQRPDLSRRGEDWATFHKLSREQFQDVHKKEVERQCTLHEIVMSEDIYWCQLQVLRILYRDDLQSWNPPIINPNKLPKFIKSVFGGVDELKLVNEVYLLHPLHQKQELEGPWISGFSDIFGHWLQAARQPYLDYAAGFPWATYLIRREADRSVSFQLFLDQARDNRLSGRLDWYTHLKAPITKVQQYLLLLGNVLKCSQHIEEETEKAKLSAVINDLKEFLREIGSVIDENSMKVELVVLQSKLYFRPGMRKVELHLDHLGRGLILKGNLQRTRANRFTWIETHAILFDHYLVLAKTVVQRGSAAGRKKEVYDVSKSVSLSPEYQPILN